jgi:hypothetical protein
MLPDKPDKTDFPCANTDRFRIKIEKANRKSRDKKLFFMVKPVLNCFAKKYLAHPVPMEAYLSQIFWIYPFFLHSTKR